ncbi:MAG: hypothetical protein B6D39_06550 [Anaerolineae bacterium UTCFX2]|jgi:hypothetical protein|nr:hypothetical protein [Anaerolineae bacterium]MCZ7552519.1 hypothetical protein [Anaerolineales bacterium]OQY91606.1 MAG: hypothetical protein B6D39_06550 [Anaerolineae bacterium UTCFX2]
MFIKKLSCVLIILAAGVAPFLVAAPTVTANAGMFADRVEASALLQPAASPPVSDPIFPIFVNPSYEYSPVIAYNSVHNEYLVVWESVLPGNVHKIYARRIASDGRQLISFTVSSNANNQMNPSVAYDPTHDRYLVVFVYDLNGDASNWDVHGRFIPWSGPSASLLDFSICNFSSNQGHPVTVFASTQQEFLVVWVNFQTSVASYISARRVWADGSGFPYSPFVVSSGTENRDYPDVAYNPSRNEYLVVWDVVKTGSAVDIYGIRLSGEGTPLTGGTPSVTGEFSIAGWSAIEEKPAVAACAQADQFLVAWQSDQSKGDYAIYARYLSGTAALGNVYQIVDTTSDQFNADMTCGPGGRYLVVWQDEYTTGEFGVWGRLASPSESFDDEFLICGPHQNADREYPAVNGGSISYLVAWEHDIDGGASADIYGRLLRHTIYMPLIRR